METKNLPTNNSPLPTIRRRKYFQGFDNLTRVFSKTHSLDQNHEAQEAITILGETSPLAEDWNVLAPIFQKSFYFWETS